MKLIHYLILVLLGALLLPFGVSAQQCTGALCWERGTANPNYLLAFVASDNTHTHYDGPTQRYTTSFGTDAFIVDKVQSRAELWVLHPQRTTPIKIFPLPSHLSGGLIDAPPELGAVVEPNASLDGNSVIFGYLHDVRQGYQELNRLGQAPLGSDLYKIDLTPLRLNPTLDPNTLPVTRLTYQPAHVNAHAQNPAAADALDLHWTRPFNLHAVEMQTELGVRVVFASDRRHVQNSNHGWSNFNLFIASYGPQGSLVNDTQFQHYSTTSAVSPTNLREGIAYSYQASTEDSRHWQIQRSDSSGVWGPLAGYGRGAFASFHLGTLCATTTAQGDYWFSTAYYPNKNNGFGGILGLPMSTAGKNRTYENPGSTGIRMPIQAGEFLLTTSVEWNQDRPALMDGGSYVGKFTTPRCGRVNEMFLSWSPTAAHNVYSGTVGVNPPPYDAEIVFRSDLTTPAYPRAAGAFPRVLNETTGVKSLLWPTPMISQQERFGTPPQPAYRQSNITGMPEAAIGTSALHNTDIVPRECRAPGRNYDPNKVVGDELKNSTVLNVAGLSFVRDNNPQSIQDICAVPVLPANVFGVAINMTDNKTDSQALQPVPSRKESVRRLGVVRNDSQVSNGVADRSFRAIIPANVPFEMHLLHKRYALRMADVRSWHSLVAGEDRHDCGGCHNHNLGDAPVEWEGSTASGAQYQSEDLVNTTPVVEYDSNCMPQVVVRNTPAESVPLWGDGTPLYQKFVQNCGGCHSANGSGAAMFVVGANALETFQNLTGNQRKFLNEDEGALGSPAFWAARGERTDGRNNNNPYFSRGFQYSTVHNSLGLCASLDNWVYEFGLWIDNHMPRQWLYNGTPYETDRFHPAVHFALADRSGCTSGAGLSVGVWDDSGGVSLVEVSRNGTLVGGQSTFRPNGVVSFPLTLGNSTDIVTVSVRDASGNIATARATFEELIHQCQTGSDPRTEQGGIHHHPSGTPTPTPSPTPSPTPPGGGSALIGPGPGKLSFSPRNAQPGSFVLVRISAPQYAGMDFVVVGGRDSANPGFEILAANGRVVVPTTNDAYTDATRTNLRGRLDSKGRGEVSISVPSGLPAGTRQVPHVAIFYFPNENRIAGITSPSNLRIRSRGIVRTVAVAKRIARVSVAIQKLDNRLSTLNARLGTLSPSSKKAANLRAVIARTELRRGLELAKLAQLERAVTVGATLE